MSSLRNAIQRRNHRERAQPKEREKWGLLEKHKDYSARARDFNAKKTKLRVLRQKVVEKNPDEFYFGMMSRRGPSVVEKNGSGTVNGDRGNHVLSQDSVRLFKTQDLGYIRTMRNKTRQEVDLLEERVLGIKTEGRRVIYVDNQEEQRQKVVGDDGENGATSGGLETDELYNSQQKERRKLETRLKQARERLKVLTETEEALDLQRAKMAKSTTVGGINKHGIKFKVRERKR